MDADGFSAVPLTEVSETVTRRLSATSVNDTVTSEPMNDTAAVPTGLAVAPPTEVIAWLNWKTI